MDNGIGLLEDCLPDCLISLNDVFVILSGDLNSRTSNISQHITTDTIVESRSKSSPTNIDRCSEDGVLNSYGKTVEYVYCFKLLYSQWHVSWRPLVSLHIYLRCWKQCE